MAVSNWGIAGWEDGDGNWHDVEKGAEPPTNDELLESEQIVVWWDPADANGEPTGDIGYATMWSVVGWEYDELEGLIEDAEDYYSAQAAG